MSKVSIHCPCCRHPFNSDRRADNKDSCVAHMVRVHGLDRTRAVELLIESGEVRPGCPLELAIKEWDELVKAGVIKEVTLSATTPEGTTYQQETEVEWTPPPNTAVKVAEMKKEDRL